MLERMAEAVFVDRDVPIERIDLGDGAWVDVGRGWLRQADEVYEHLLAEVPWQSSHLFRYDHVVEERRVGAWWSRGNPLPHPALAEATRVLQHRYRVEFGGFAMLQYRDGTDGQAFHRDTDMRYLEDTIIAVLSLGATRPWCLRPRSARHSLDVGKGATHDLQPASGDLLVMGGRCQADWEHSVPVPGCGECRRASRCRSSGGSPASRADRSRAPATGRRSTTAGTADSGRAGRAGWDDAERCRAPSRTTSPSCPIDRRPIVEVVRQVVLDHLPDGFEEVMQYGMISYVVPHERYPDTYNGQPLALASLASQKRYLSLYLMGVYGDAGAEAWLRERWPADKKLDMGKSCLRFKRLDDLSLDLIGEVIASTSVDDFSPSTSA